MSISDDEIRRRLSEMEHEGHSAEECHYRQDMQFLLDEVERLRAEFEDKDKEFHDYANHAESVVEQYQTKLAKAVAALKEIDQLQLQLHADIDITEGLNAIEHVARQTLKEIQGEVK